MSNHENRRSSRLVNRSLQYKFLSMFLIYSFILVFFLILFLFVPDILQMGNQALSLDLRASAADRVLFRHVWVWPSVIILIGLFAFHSFRTFWRVIGPLYRFQTVLAQVGQGDLNYPIKIRKKDYLKQEEETLNLMLQILSEKIDRIRKSTDNSLSSLNELEKAINDETGGNVAYIDLLSSHRRHLERILETVRFFRVVRIMPKTASGPKGI